MAPTNDYGRAMIFLDFSTAIHLLGVYACPRHVRDDYPSVTSEAESRVNVCPECSKIGLISV